MVMEKSPLRCAIVSTLLNRVEEGMRADES